MTVRCVILRPAPTGRRAVAIEQREADRLVALGEARLLRPRLYEAVPATPVPEPALDLSNL